jgi:hypothetical protein
MTLRERLEFDLHNGEEIQGMKRFNAYYLGHNDDKTQTILFDNGNQYTVTLEGDVLEYINGEDEVFIDRQIIKAVIGHINNSPTLTKDYDYSFSNYNECIEIYWKSKLEKADRVILIRIVLNRAQKTIEIPNIFLPNELRLNGFGKNILSEVFKVAANHGYKLFLIQMVEGFFNQMVKRGAEIIVDNDIVEITERTNLS